MKNRISRVEVKSNSVFDLGYIIKTTDDVGITENSKFLQTFMFPLNFKLHYSSQFENYWQLELNNLELSIQYPSLSGLLSFYDDYNRSFNNYLEAQTQYSDRVKRLRSEIFHDNIAEKAVDAIKATQTFALNVQVNQASVHMPLLQLVNEVIHAILTSLDFFVVFLKVGI